MHARMTVHNIMHFHTFIRIYCLSTNDYSLMLCISMLVQYRCLLCRASTAAYSTPFHFTSIPLANNTCRPPPPLTLPSYALPCLATRPSCISTQSPFPWAVTQDGLAGVLTDVGILTEAIKATSIISQFHDQVRYFPFQTHLEP